MKTLTCAVAAVAAALLAASPGTAGKGGPTPDPLGGWDGVVSASGTVRYVALPGRGATTVAGVRVSDGRVLRYATVLGYSASHRSRGMERRTASRRTARGSCWPRSRAARSASRRRSSSCGQRTRGSARDRAVGPLGVGRDIP